MHIIGILQGILYGINYLFPSSLLIADFIGAVVVLVELG